MLRMGVSVSQELETNTIMENQRYNKRELTVQARVEAYDLFYSFILLWPQGFNHCSREEDYLQGKRRYAWITQTQEEENFVCLVF